MGEGQSDHLRGILQLHPEEDEGRASRRTIPSEITHTPEFQEHMQVLERYNYLKGDAWWNEVTKYYPRHTSSEGF